MRRTPPLCPVCGNGCYRRTTERVFADELRAFVPAVKFYRCDACGDVAFPPAAARYVQAYVRTHAFRKEAQPA